ncbi:MAG: hypothetical protein JNG84_00430 [Archangium sp.]|nr:hypothetical protein [Archangium sp.]
MNRVMLTLLAVCALACPKAAPTSTVAGSDDEQMDAYSAQLEEYRTKADLSCDDSCAAKKKVCGISAKVCELATKSSERQDFQSKCVSAQEDCAKFNESCTACKGR